MGSEQNISITIAQLYVKLRILTYIIAQNNNKLLCVLPAPPCPRPSVHCSSLVLRSPSPLSVPASPRPCSSAPILRPHSNFRRHLQLHWFWACILPLHTLRLACFCFLISLGFFPAFLCSPCCYVSSRSVWTKLLKRFYCSALQNFKQGRTKLFFFFESLRKKRVNISTASF